MGKCHGITIVHWIVKHLVSYMAAAQQDNRLISWLSEPHRTIMVFLRTHPDFAGYSSQTGTHIYWTQCKHVSHGQIHKTHNIYSLNLCSYSFLSRQWRKNQGQPAGQSQESIGFHFFPFLNWSTVHRCQREQRLTLHKIPLTNTEFPSGFGPTVQII